MSLDTLPTELHDQVLTYLDHDALNTMSLTSKAYRGITEPFLYRHIVLKAEKLVSIRWLVVTILYRPDLAAHIKTIMFDNTTRTTDVNANGSANAEHLSAHLEQKISKLHEMTANALGTGLETASTRVSWLGEVLADDHLEGSLTLIAYLAFNLESLIVRDGGGPGEPPGYYGKLLTSTISEAFNHWCQNPHLHDTSVASAHAAPFSHLQLFQFKTHAPVRITTLPTLRTIRIEGCDEFSVSHIFPTQASHSLQYLEIIDNFGSPESIKDILDANRATDLRRLVLRDFCAVPDRSYQPVIDALLGNCFKLEYLEIVMHKPTESDDMPLQGLSGLISLKELRIDLNALVSWQDRMPLLTLNKLLPPSLEALHVTSVCAFELCEVVTPFLVPPYQAHFDLSRLYQLANLSSFGRLTITVDLDPDPGFGHTWQQIVPLLLHLSANLFARGGLLLQVYRTAWREELEDKLLVDHCRIHEDLIVSSPYTETE